MGSTALIVALLFGVVASAAVLGGWWYASRVKRELDAPLPSAAASRGTIELAPASVEQLRRLTPEPILLTQSPEGVRVQIECRPMLPIMAFAGSQASGAIAEAATALTERYGPRWVALVSLGDDGGVVVQRLA